VEHDGSLATLDSEALQLLPSTTELRNKGESAKSLQEKDYSALELIESGFPLKEVLACGYCPRELEEAGYIRDQKMKTNIAGKDIDGVYHGICKGEQAEGEGVCEYSNGDLYQGCWKENLRSGEGRESKQNGNIYQGSWLWGKMHGRGIQTIYHDGKKTYGKEKAGTYIGDFSLNERHGHGKFTSGSG
jgi:hypothetical protein